MAILLSLLLVTGRTLRVDCGYLLGEFAFDAGNSGFLCGGDDIEIHYQITCRLKFGIAFLTESNDASAGSLCFYHSILVHANIICTVIGKYREVGSRFYLG